AQSRPLVNLGMTELDQQRVPGRHVESGIEGETHFFDQGSGAVRVSVDGEVGRSAIEPVKQVRDLHRVDPLKRVVVVGAGVESFDEDLLADVHAGGQVTSSSFLNDFPSEMTRHSALVQ